MKSGVETQKLMFKPRCRDGRCSGSDGFLSAGAVCCSRNAQELQPGATTAKLGEMLMLMLATTYVIRSVCLSELEPLLAAPAGLRMADKCTFLLLR